MVRGIHAVAQSDPTRPALVCGGAVTTFGELDERANALAQAYAKAGAGHGDRVAVMLGNRPDLFAAWVGAARVGALVVPVSHRFTPAEVTYLVEDSGARVLVHADDSVAIAVADAVGDGSIATLHVEDEALAAAAAPPVDDFIETPVMWMSYTSGTTGRPKGIKRPTPQPARDAPPQPYMQFWGFGGEDVHLLCGPAYHTAPGAYAYMHLVEGATVVVMPRWDAGEALALIQEHRVTSSHMVPANFVRILELPQERRAAYDLSSIGKILHSAAPCPESVKRRIIDVFPPGVVWEYYGASEGMGTVISPDEWLRKPGSVGRAFPGLEIRILDENGAELAPGQVGTIYLSAVPGYAFEYHNAPEKTADAWRDGRFTVGDLGYVDEDGYLYIADRRTDLILRGGVNVYPAEIEGVLAEHPDVVDSAVFGMPDDRLGQRVHVVIEPRRGVAIDADGVRAFLGGRLADFKIPEAVEFVEELPREPNGKILKHRLREQRLTA